MSTNETNETLKLNPKANPEGLKKLLATSRHWLTNVEQQAQFIARLYSSPMPCPMCFNPVTVYEAGDDTQTVGELYTGRYECPHCKTELAKIVPFVIQPGTPGWDWRRKHPIAVAEAT